MDKLSLEGLLKVCHKSNCYMITATFIEKGVLHHQLITQGFPRAEMLSSHHETEKLVIGDIDVAGKN